MGTKIMAQKTKAQIAIESDARVASVSDERGTGDGVWVYLKPGFKSSSTDTGSIHESCWSACLKVLKGETYEVDAEAEDAADAEAGKEAGRLARAAASQSMVARYLAAHPEKIDGFAELSHDDRVLFVMEHAEFAKAD
jgi:hypothetical protein